MSCARIDCVNVQCFSQLPRVFNLKKAPSALAGRGEPRGDIALHCGETAARPESPRLQESEKQLENLEFKFLNKVTIDSSEESFKTLQKSKLNTERVQNNLCTVSNGLCCCLEPIRSLRKLLNKWCELAAKIQFYLQCKGCR